MSTAAAATAGGDEAADGPLALAAELVGRYGRLALVALIANADSVSVCSPSPCPTPPPDG